MKTITVFLYIFFYAFIGNTQNRVVSRINNSDDITFIRNKTIKYSLVLSSCDSCIPITTKGYRIRTNLTDEQIGKVHKLTYVEWIDLLNSPKSNWAANLILYQIFDKDAIPLYSFNNRKKWLKYFKEQDLDFWKQKLKLHSVGMP